MAFRFRRSVKIAPGIRVNFSSSGTSMTVGPRGYTTTYSKRGKYRNVSIPGTGLSTRYKVSGPRPKSTGRRATASTRKVSNGSGVPAAVREWIAYTGEREPSAKLGMELDGTIVIFDKGGNPITDPQLIGIIKRTPVYKEQLPRLKELHRAEVAERVAEDAEENEALIKICRLSPQVLPIDYYQRQLDGLQAQRYIPKAYEVPAPTEVDVQIALSEEADRNVRGLPWQLRKLKEEYFAERYAQRLSEAISSWRAEKDAFDESERAKADELNSRYYEEYQEVKWAFEDSLEGSTEYVEAAAEQWIESSEIPFEIYTQYEYRESEHCLMVDLDLPEIEDLPNKISVQTAGGDLRVKDKTQKLLREEYAELAFGMAIFVASNLFNLSPQIWLVTISGYTQRRNRVGEICDDYIYSIKLPRESLYGIDYDSLDPESFCMRFENRCNVSPTKVFKAIEPYQ